MSQARCRSITLDWAFPQVALLANGFYGKPSGSPRLLTATLPLVAWTEHRAEILAAKRLVAGWITLAS
jgi:hypothetical protein